MTVLAQLTNLFNLMNTEDAIEITLKKKHQDSKEKEVKVSLDIADLSNILTSVELTENYQRSLEKKLFSMFDKQELEEITKDEAALERKPKDFYVKCVEDFDIKGSNGNFITKVEADEEFKVNFHEETEEYFADDSKKRNILVGALDKEGLLVINKSFRLLPVSQQKFNYIYSW